MDGDKLVWQVRVPRFPLEGVFARATLFGYPPITENILCTICCLASAECPTKPVCSSRLNMNAVVRVRVFRRCGAIITAKFTRQGALYVNKPQNTQCQPSPQPVCEEHAEPPDLLPAKPGGGHGERDGGGEKSDHQQEFFAFEKA